MLITADDLSFLKGTLLSLSRPPAVDRLPVHALHYAKRYRLRQMLNM